MIRFKTQELDNGLKVILHQDPSSALTHVNLLYNVGAKDEDPERTGFAHLFEHLMFSGSKNAPSFDLIVDRMGGENNAFTNNDITNYYISIPSNQLSNALWLESDRVHNLNINQKSLDVQKNVVIEEFKQRYLNQPYGDLWALIRDLSYKQHPYRWPTIGKDISHIEDASLEDVRAFYQKHYQPSNAVLCLSGNIDLIQAQDLVEEHFSELSNQSFSKPALIQEPLQTEPRYKTVEREVPQSAIIVSFLMSSRLDPLYHAYDFLSDLLSNGKSSRFYQSLVKDQELFTDINAFITGDTDQGLFVIIGRLREDVEMSRAEELIWKELDRLNHEEISDYEFNKVKNKFKTTHSLSNLKALNRAMNLSYFQNLGDANLINTDLDTYTSLNQEDIINLAKERFQKKYSNTLYYLGIKS